jgi:hypothetical protein
MKEDRRGKVKTYPALPTQISREADFFDIRLLALVQTISWASLNRVSACVI